MIQAPGGRVRLALGVVGLTASAVPLRRNRIGPREEGFFRAVNDLPDWLHPPSWAVMQLGALGAAPAAAGVAYLLGERRLSLRLAVTGTSAWGLAKVVKQIARRGRPSAVLPEVHGRGPEAAGHGFLSGHTAVATTLALAASPALRGPLRWLVFASAAATGLSRIYVGAHLPLDVLGGASLALVVDGATSSAAWSRPQSP